MEFMGSTGKRGVLLFLILKHEKIVGEIIKIPSYQDDS